MSRERLYLFDTTLRDGAQTNGVDFTLADKLAIARMLDELGVDYVEAGYPGANPTDTQLLRRAAAGARENHRLRHDAAAGPLGLERSGPRRAARRARPTRSASSPSPGTITSASRWRRPKRKTSPRSATACAPPRPRAAKCCSTASISSTATRPIRLTRSPAPRRPTTKARAGWCCATPMAARCRTKSRRSSARSASSIPGDHVGIHAHNDTEQAVANSFAAVRAGARQIQGTLNGLGERCGNANLVSIIPTLKLKPEYAQTVRDRRVRRSARPASRASRTRSTICSTAPPTATRPMSARARSPPRPASTPRPS